MGQKFQKIAKLVVVQPHRYSRIKNLELEFAKCFKKASTVILCPVYAAGEKKDVKYDQVKFAKLINRFSNVQVIIVQGEIDLAKYLRKNLIKMKS